LRIHRRLPVTSPARTLFDEARVLTHRKLELAFDRALVSGGMRLPDVAELLTRVRGRPGAPVLAGLLAHHTGPTLTRSEAEELFLELIRQAGLPPPRVNARTSGYEVDFLWPERRLVVEVDGFRFHSTRRAFDHDHRKDLDLKAAGLTVLRFTYEQLRREPLLVIAQLTRALTGQVATVSAPSSWEMATSTE
jgi:very-short-patch-repair endonuclease